MAREAGRELDGESGLVNADLAGQEERKYHHGCLLGILICLFEMVAAKIRIFRLWNLCRRGINL